MYTPADDVAVPSACATSMLWYISTIIQLVTAVTECLQMSADVTLLKVQVPHAMPQRFVTEGTAPHGYHSPTS